MQRKVAGTVTHVEGIAAGASLWNDPVLADNIPDTKILAGNLEGDIDGCAGCKLDFFEATELTDGGIEAAIRGEPNIPRFN